MEKGFNIDKNALKKCIGKEEETIPDNLLEEYVDYFMNSPIGRELINNYYKEPRKTFLTIFNDRSERK